MHMLPVGMQSLSMETLGNNNIIILFHPVVHSLYPFEAFSPQDGHKEEPLQFDNGIEILNDNHSKYKDKAKDKDKDYVLEDQDMG